MPQIYTFKGNLKWPKMVHFVGTPKMPQNVTFEGTPKCLKRSLLETLLKSVTKDLSLSGYKLHFCFCLQKSLKAFF